MVTWVDRAPPALSAANLNTLATQVAIGETINVKDPAYGAEGDDATDDTAAFAAAINAAYRADMTAEGAFMKHRRVVVPPGVYRVQKVNLWSTSNSNGVWLDAPDGAVLKGITDGQNVVNIRGNDCTLTNFTITRLAGHSTGHGVATEPTTNVTLLRTRLANCAIIDQPQDGVHADRLEHGIFTNVSCNSNGRYGWYFFNGSTAFGFENLLLACKARDNVSTGLLCDGQQNFTFSNFESFNNDPNGGASGCQIRFLATSQQSGGHVLINPDVENFDGDGLGVGIKFIGSGNSVIGGSAYQVKFGVYLNSASYTSCVGFRAFRSSTLSGSATVIVDGGSHDNDIHAPFGTNMDGQVSFDAAALATFSHINERLELRASRVAGFERTLDVDDTTPDVRYGDWWVTANTVSTTITAFDNVQTRMMQIVFGDANTTLQHGASIKLRGAVNWTPASGDRILFICHTGVAYEVSRETATSSGAVLRGSGSPESAVTAAVGTLYCRTDGGAGTTLYVKESGAGNTGWVGK